MISPDELLKKVQNKYSDVLKASLTGQELFPLTIRANLSLVNVEQSQASKQIKALTNYSKECRGYGYSIEWEQRSSRRFGKNDFPSRIYFETRNDMLQYLNELDSFKAFERTCSLIKSEFPQLTTWLESNLSLVQKKVVSNVTELLEICSYLSQHPQPGCFVRELPIAVETKFIEKNESILRQWLDLILQASVIQSHEDDFYIRYGLRRSRNHFLVRILDESLCDFIGINFEEFSLPFEAMRTLALKDVRVFIVENKTNLLTLPKMLNTLALGGVGNAVLKFKHFIWLHNCQLNYWGDMDVEGFEILSRLRTFLPHTTSIFMDTQTFSDHKQLATKGNARQVIVPSNLTPLEQKVFAHCHKNNLRLEQEKISQKYIDNRFE